MAKGLVVAGASTVLIFGTAWLAFSLTYTGYCSSPRFLSNGDLPPNLFVESMVQDLGGLPKASTYLTSISYPWRVLLSEGKAYPVADWEIIQVRAHNNTPLWEQILESEALYSIDVDIRVDYADGDKSLLRWSTWRYGLLLCPLVVDGNGAMGEIEVISLSSG